MLLPYQSVFTTFDIFHVELFTVDGLDSDRDTLDRKVSDIYFHHW